MRTASLGDCREDIAHAFGEFMDASGFACHAPGGIIPEHDRSVLFTGSAISTLKPYLEDWSIPQGGFWIVQSNIRTQNLSVLEESDAAELHYASFFRTLGVFARGDQFARIASQTLRFLLDVVGIPRTRLLIRASSRDLDLLSAIESLGFHDRLELDGSAQTTYRHRFGMVGVAGRNVNVALTSPSGRRRDLGNIIAIERLVPDPSTGQSTEALAVETALGLEVIVSQLFDLPSPIYAARVADSIEVHGPAAGMLADALATSIAMIEAGVAPVVSNRGRILRRYLQTVPRLRRIAAIEREELAPRVEAFARAEFGREASARRVLDYMQQHEALLAMGIVSRDAMNRRLAAECRWW